MVAEWARPLHFAIVKQQVARIGEMVRHELGSKLWVCLLYTSVTLNRLDLGAAE